MKKYVPAAWGQREPVSDPRPLDSDCPSPGPCHLQHSYMFKYTVPINHWQRARQRKQRHRVRFSEFPKQNGYWSLERVDSAKILIVDGTHPVLVSGKQVLQKERYKILNMISNLINVRHKLDYVRSVRNIRTNFGQV